MPTGSPTSPETSRFYSAKPIFVNVPTPKKRSRLEGHRFLLTMSVVIIIAAIVSGFFYFQRQPTALSQPSSSQLPQSVPLQTTTSP